MATIATPASVPVISAASVLRDSPKQEQRSLGPYAFCKGRHGFEDCLEVWNEEKYPDGNAVRAVFFKNGQCFNCGECGHTKPNCKRREPKCEWVPEGKPTCGGKHLTCLHVDDLLPNPRLGDFMPRTATTAPATAPTPDSSAAPNQAPTSAAPRRAPNAAAPTPPSSTSVTPAIIPIGCADAPVASRALPLATQNPNLRYMASDGRVTVERQPASAAGSVAA